MAYKLLLADDSITIQKVVELVLAEEDFQIKSVSNGEDAINLLSSFQPDIVLADIEIRTGEFSRLPGNPSPVLVLEHD